LLKHRFHRGEEVVLNGATKATIGQFNNGWRGAGLLLIADLTALEQLSINANLAELIDQHSQPLLRLPQELAQNRCFASAKKPGDHGHRQTGCGCHAQATISDQLKAQPMPIQMPAAKRMP